MRRGTGPGGRPPQSGRRARIAAAVTLLLGGVTAVAAGAGGAEGPPPAPAAFSTPSPAASSVASAPASAPTEAAEPGARATAPAAGATAPLPTAITIPAIDVSSDLITVGLNPDGTLEVPQPGPDYDKAAWFDGSPRPGEVGPSVIEGHVDSARGGPSVFYSLGALTSGDRVEVARQDGSRAVFAVREVRVYPKDEFPTYEVYRNTAGPELRLITCGGEFDRSTGHYRDNTVVFAEQVEVLGS
jgi:sortase (surface protein transpeptidase)